MDTNDVPMALRHRLGEPATAGLVELLDGTKREWTADVIAIVGERFERRLVAETSALRVEMAQGFASVRVETAEGLAVLRREMAEGLASVRQDMAQQRVELLKWAFVFWMGQFVAMVSLFALGIRLLRPGA